MVSTSDSSAVLAAGNARLGCCGGRLPGCLNGTGGDPCHGVAGTICLAFKALLTESGTPFPVVRAGDAAAEVARPPMSMSMDRTFPRWADACGPGPRTAEIPVDGQTSSRR